MSVPLCLILSLSFFSIRSHAAEKPKDLEGLLKRWERVEKNESFTKLMNLEERSMTGVSSEQISAAIFTNEIEASRIGEKNQLKSVNFESLDIESRKSILKRLFPKTIYIQSFCAAYKNKVIKIDESDMSEDEKKEHVKKIRLAQCKRNTDFLLGGVLHADLNVYLLETKNTAEMEKQKLVFYVQSMIDESYFLRYEFQVN